MCRAEQHLVHNIRVVLTIIKLRLKGVQSSNGALFTKVPEMNGGVLTSGNNQTAHGTAVDCCNRVVMF